MLSKRHVFFFDIYLSRGIVHQVCFMLHVSARILVTDLTGLPPQLRIQPISLECHVCFDTLKYVPGSYIGHGFAQFVRFP